MIFNKIMNMVTIHLYIGLWALMSLHNTGVQKLITICMWNVH